VATGAKKKVIGIHESVKRNPRNNFFSAQLAGEEALTHATAENLFDLASEVYSARLWERIGDTDLVLVKDPVSGQICYCVMGALGEYCAVHMYLDSESYGFFKRIQLEETISAGDFYGSQSGVTAEFVASAELTGPDKELARAFGHPLSRWVGGAPVSGESKRVPALVCHRARSESVSARLGERPGVLPGMETDPCQTILGA
jgi:hypothetical protein